MEDGEAMDAEKHEMAAAHALEVETLARKVESLTEAEALSASLKGELELTAETEASLRSELEGLREEHAATAAKLSAERAESVAKSDSERAAALQAVALRSELDSLRSSHAAAA